jgi:methionyl aminopeptidase
MTSESIGEFYRSFKERLLSKAMIIGKSKKEIDKMRVVGELVGTVREALVKKVKPGISTMELNDEAEKMIRDAGAYPTFLNYHGYPYAICASVNEAVVHGFPSDYVLRVGDILSLDLGATLNGFVGDSAVTVPVGEISEELEQLLKVTNECLDKGIEQCVAGNHVGDIGHAVQKHAERFGYGIVRDYCGHGIGRNMHESPQIVNYGRPGTKEKIRVGYVFALEPMINLGSHETRVLEDKWTVVTLDSSPSAHFEHTVAITEEGPEILTLSPEQKKLRQKSAVSA